MIYSLTGKATFVGENTLSIDIGNISFEVFCSANTIIKATSENETTLLTYLQVKEDGMSLFGFAEREEKALFLNLISVSGIGPKMAIGVLSSASVNQIIKAINSNDVKLLSSVKGLGKKTAERICLELKDKVSGFSDSSETVSAAFSEPSQAKDDAVSVLVSLGFIKSDAVKLVNAYSTKEMTAEEMVSNALRHSGR